MSDVRLSAYYSPPSLSSSPLNSVSYSSRPLSSHSEASLAPPSPSSATGGWTCRPWLHRSPANSSAILVRYLSRVWARKLLLLQDGCPEGLLLAFPLRAVLEHACARESGSWTDTTSTGRRNPVLKSMMKPFLPLMARSGGLQLQ